MTKVKLKDICFSKQGFAFKSDNFISDAIPIVRIGNITDNGLIIDNNICYSEDIWNDKPEYRIEFNDILIAMSGATVGKSCINKSNSKLLLNQRVTALRAKEGVCNQYIYHIIISKKFDDYVKLVSAGCAQPNISNKQILDFEIPLPSLEDQKKIADTLDKVTKLINKRKKQLEKLDELVKSRFVEMFGDFDLSQIKDEWVKISSIGDVVGGSTPKTSNSEYWDGEYRWLTPAELKADTGYIYDSERKITKSGAESCSLKEMPINTVILTSRAPIGKVAIAGTTFYCNQGFKNIICNDRIVPRYLYSLLLYNVDYLNSLGRGATFKEISKSIVENILIPLPPITKQTQFAVFVENIDKSKI